MKVRELIEKLQKAPQDYDVQTEGCDCCGDVVCVQLVTKDKEVMLVRSDARFVDDPLGEAL